MKVNKSEYLCTALPVLLYENRHETIRVSFSNHKQIYRYDNTFGFSEAAGGLMQAKVRQRHKIACE